MRLKNTADNFSASFHITPPYQMVVIHSSKLIYPRELYQRGIQRKRVELIAKDFNEYTANEPKVSFRNGRYYVTDGQHTIEARILRNGGKDLPILCKIYTGLTMQQEALFFAEQNGHAAPLTAGIKLRAKVVGEDAPSVAFLAATNRVGLDFNYDSLQLSAYRISCVGTALKLYNQMGEKIYCEALRLIVAAWEGKPDSFRATDMRAMMHYVELNNGEISKESETMVMNDLRAHFRPVFLNRLDETIMFKPLTKQNVYAIIDLLLKDVNKRLEDKELSIELTDAAKNFVVEGGYEPMYGARPLKRYLQKHVETLAAKLILAGDVGRGDTILIDVKDGKLTAGVKK